MQRVVIVGCPATGKSTFSIKLAKVVGLPLHFLDYDYHDDAYEYQTNKPRWRERVAALASADKWIIEGNFKSTFDIRFPRADTIIYFDYPRHLAIYRALKRRIQNHNQTRPGMPPNWREKITREFAMNVWRFNSKERPVIYELIERYKDEKEIIIFALPRDAQAYLDALQAK